MDSTQSGRCARSDSTFIVVVVVVLVAAAGGYFAGSAAEKTRQAGDRKVLEATGTDLQDKLAEAESTIERQVKALIAAQRKLRDSEEAVQDAATLVGQTNENLAHSRQRITELEREARRLREIVEAVPEFPEPSEEAVAWAREFRPSELCPRAREISRKLANLATMAESMEKMGEARRLAAARAEMKTHEDHLFAIVHRMQDIKLHVPPEIYSLEAAD